MQMTIRLDSLIGSGDTHWLNALSPREGEVSQNHDDVGISLSAEDKVQREA
jgi:hypothetical protein